MTETELLALIDQEEAQCLSSSGELAEQRREALQYYNGMPYGNEVPGRSQVVTTETQDAVEGVMPSLMAIFTSSDEVVRFEPEGEEDEEGAQQETDTVNYVFSRANNGFVGLYSLFKDALLQKNGYVKVYWEEYEYDDKETYEGLNDVEFAMLSQDQELEVVSHETTEGLHKATFKKSKKYGKVCIDPVPPEEVLVSRDAKHDLNKARFVEHRTLKTISQIREMGFDVEDDIQDAQTDATFNSERTERMRPEGVETTTNDSSADPASREVWLCEAYPLVDFDGDGIAERRKVTKIGRKILENEEFDSVPILGGTAILQTHKHTGRSLHDLVKDLQLISSTIWRQLFDNAYNQNNQQMEVLDGMVNMDDLLTSRPGGIKRVKAMGSIKPIVSPLIGPPFYELLDRVAQIKQNRIGVMDFANQVDPDALNAKAHTAEIVRNAAAERINLMARILAETVVKDIFIKIRELLSKHQDKQLSVKLRNKWVTVSPRDWKKRLDTTVTVGLGTGSQGALQQGAMGIMQIQTAAMQAGLKDRIVTEKNIYAAAHRYAKAVFPKDADMFFTNPVTMGPPQPPPPDPKIITAQIAAEAQKTIAGAQLQSDQRTQAEKKAFDSEKTQYREMMASMAQQRDHQAQAQQQMVDLAAKDRGEIRQAVMDAAKEAATQQAEHMMTLVQGMIDERLQAQAAEQDKETAIAVAKAKPKLEQRPAK